MKRVLVLITGLVWFASTGCVVAQSFPTRPVHFIVPYSVGGGTDIVARVIGQKLSDLWGEGVVVANRPVTGSTLGTNIAAKRPPDDYGSC